MQGATQGMEQASGGRLSADKRGLGNTPVLGFLWALRRKPIGLVSLVVLLIFVVIAAAAPWTAPYAYDASTDAYAEGPSLSHWFGTDHLGRDVLSRVIWGGRVSLQVGFVSVFFGVIIGSTIGLVSGYFGGKIDMVTQRVVDVFMALPVFLLAITVVAALGAGVLNITIAIAIGMIPGISRVVRGSTLSVKETPYIEAAVSIGSQTGRVLIRHVLPNVLAAIIVVVSIRLGVAIIAEASLSFLGIGVPPNEPTWGNMLSGAALSNMTRAPWMALFPGIALTVTVLALNLFGDAARDILDPRMRGSK